MRQPISVRKTWRVGLPGAVLLAASGLLVHPASGEGELGGFVAVASAQAIRVSYEADGFLIVRSLLDSGGPVSQAVVNSIDGQSFASLPYPGETPLSGPGLIAANGGPTLPAYPFYVNASSTNPEQKFSDPANAYSIVASVTNGEAAGEARVGGGSEDAIATGQRTFASAGANANAVTAKGETTVEGVSLGGGALRIASVHSRSVTTYVSGAAEPETATELVVEGGRAGTTTFAYGPEGLKVAGGGIPLPAGEGLAAINQALAPAGLALHFVGASEVPGGKSAGALEITQAGELPTGGHGKARLRFGATATGITVGGGDTALLPPAPDPPFEPPSADGGTVSAPQPDSPGAVDPSLGAVNVDGGLSGVAIGGLPTGPVSSSSSPVLPRAGVPGSRSGSSMAGSAPVVTGSSQAPATFHLRKSSTVGIGYAAVVITAVLLFVVSSVWRRGSFTL